MGNCYYRTADRETGYEQKKTFLADKEALLIPAGQFAYLLSKEEINVPNNAMAFISMRTSMKFQGLINVSGFHVDPGYKGKLIYAVYNASPSPIQICENDDVFKIWFCDIDCTSARTYDGPPFNDITNDVVKGMNKEIFSLQSIAEKMRALENSMNARLAGLQPTIDYLNFIWRANYRYRCRFFGWFAPIYRAIWSTGWSTCSQNPTARTTSHRAPACPAKTALTWLGAWRRCASALPPCARSRLRSAPLLRGAGPGALSAVLLYPYPKNRCV